MLVMFSLSNSIKLMNLPLKAAQLFYKFPQTRPERTLKGIHIQIEAIKIHVSAVLLPTRRKRRFIGGFVAAVGGARSPHSS